jgi:N-acetylmuramoyl-L-alanine amidase
MRWIEVAGRARFAWLIAALAVSALLLSGAAPEKHLSVYSVAANYSLPLVQREGRDYVGLLEILEPLGKVNARADGARWRLRYYREEVDFQSGKSQCRIQGRQTEFPGKFLLEGDRGLVPVSALNVLLPKILGGPVTVHEESERLFIGNIATHFTASLAAGNPPRLVFNFTAPVNPSVSTEPGSLRLAFTRDPLVAPASPTLTFGSKAIPSATFSEGNGIAVVVVNSSVPVMATFSNDGKTITISQTAQAVTQGAAPATQAPAAAGSAAAPAQAPAPGGAASANRRYFAVVDASHGGDDRGETLSNSLLEKDVTVALARVLRQELESRGITTLVLRDSDANLAIDQRAVFANADHAAIYIALHASSAGHGVRVYTALLPLGDDDRGPFRSWVTAQHAALPLSQSAAAAVAGELQKRQIPVRTLAAPLRPLNNITGAAIGLEVSPVGADLAQLSAPDYQQLVTSAVATAVTAARDQLGAAP